MLPEAGMGAVQGLSFATVRGRHFRPHLHAVTSLAMDPEGKYFASSDSFNTWGVFDAETGHALWRRPSRAANVFSLFRNTTNNRVTAFAFALFAPILAVGFQDGRFELWDIPKRQLLSTKESSEPTASLAFHPRSARLFQGTTIWRLDDPKHPGFHARLAQDPHVTSAAFTSDGRLLATATGSRSIILFSGDAGSTLLQIPADVGPTPALATSGDYLATSRSDGRIDLWDLSKVPLAADLLRDLPSKYPLGSDATVLGHADPQQVKSFIPKFMAALARDLTPDECLQYAEVNMCIPRSVIAEQLSRSSAK